MGLVVLATLVVAPATRAQYFGKNKVQYRHLDFAVIATDHFDVYFYEGERAAAVDAARMAERAYARISRVFNHRYRERQPIILFASHSEFQQNNITDIGEGIGGVTEPFRHRILLPFTGSYAEFEHVLQHEIVHQFQFDVFARGRIGGSIPRLMAVNPPLWFTEGMAEYLSLGPITPPTAMWLRDAALEGGLPSLAELTYDPRYSPYRFGHALWSYIGERWGDAAVGELLQATAASGVDEGVRRILGVSVADLVDEWHDAIQRAYLPQIADLEQARRIGLPVLTHRTTSARLHLAPAISPDGREIAFLSEGGSFFIDLYLADATTGRVKQRLIKSAFSSDFESLRFLNSSGSWSPDARFFAIAVKHGGSDDLVIFDVSRRTVHRRIQIPLNGVSTPSWSPDGTQIVFTGYDGGFSDLFIIGADGGDLRRLTNDAYADLQPSWAPDGRAIAFTTDRGTPSDLETLSMAPVRIALYHLDTHGIEVLRSMRGRNINPVWAPDSRSVAFVSDRNGIPNLFLYELDERETYQLTNLFTGVSGITPMSPAISWAKEADRLVFTYYERREFNVYAVENPRALKTEPYREDSQRPEVASLLGLESDSTPAAGAPGISLLDPDSIRTVSLYRSPPAFMPPERALDADSSSAAASPVSDDSTSSRDAAQPPRDDAPIPRVSFHAGEHLQPPALVPAASSRPREPISVKALLDSVTLALPDPAGFTIRDYSASLAPDFIAQPTVGFVRDNFGSGFYGGSAISLSDMLSNHRLVFAGQVNGRIEEAQILGVYANLSRRVNWASGAQQSPYFYFTGSSASAADSLGVRTVTTRLERFIVRQAFLEAFRPFDRFRRLEGSIRAVNVGRTAVDLVQFISPSGFVTDIERDQQGLGSVSYVQPSLAMVFDNSVSLWVGPLLGQRYRFEYAPAFGGWHFHQVLGDYRRYDQLFGPFTFATRTLFFGRFGEDGDEFPIFIGVPDLLRGYTAGSLRDHECRMEGSGSDSGCGALDQLIGSRIGVFNAELRFPLLRAMALGFAPVGIPPIEAAVFFDAGIAWDSNSRVVFTRDEGEPQDVTRSPLYSWGLSLRGNFLGFVILRADYAKPLSRGGQGAYWTLSLGPTF
jgi:Tol biopolymer transport system component